MRIGFLTYGLDRAPTGIGRYAVELLRALAACVPALDMVLLTTEREDSYNLWQRFEHHPLPGCYLLPSLMTIGNGLLSFAARRYRLDLIHDPNGIAPFLGPALGARRVVTIHDAFAYVHPETHNRLDNWRYRWQLPMAARRSDAIITVSECSRRDITHYLGLTGQPVYTVPEGIDAQFRPVEDGAGRRALLERYGIRQPYLFYVGGINARKNIARLFEAFAQIQPRYPELKLVIAGKRQWRTGEIDAAFQRLSLSEHVHFTGYVADHDLPALYSAARLFVFPSLYEGFGLPPLEAMACGTPVITSNSSSLPEVTGDAALLIDPFDVSSLAEAICRVLDDAELAADLRRRGQQQAARFGWPRTAHETAQIYHRLMEQA